MIRWIKIAIATVVGAAFCHVVSWGLIFLVFGELDLAGFYGSGFGGFAIAVSLVMMFLPATAGIGTVNK